MLTNAPKTIDYTIYTHHAYYWHTYYITTLQLVRALSVILSFLQRTCIRRHSAWANLSVGNSGQEITRSANNAFQLVLIIILSVLCVLIISLSVLCVASAVSRFWFELREGLL